METNTRQFGVHTAPARNAPSIHNRLSIAVDVIAALGDDARSLGMHGLADEAEAMAQRLVRLATELWRAEGGER